MNLSLTGKTALVTGGSRGIGKAIARGLAELGAAVAIMARRREPLLDTVEELSKETGNKIEGYCCDVADESDLKRAFSDIEKTFSGIDILINNAGNSFKRPIPKMERYEFLGDLETKLFAASTLTQLALPHMQTNRWGRIINVVSVNGKAPGNAQAPSAVSRAAGIALTKVMATELAPWDITVNALCVGRIKSDQWASWHLRDAPELPYHEYLAMKAANIPLGRMGEPEEIAAVACFLAAEASSYVTGAAINVDGGLCPVP